MISHGQITARALITGDRRVVGIQMNPTPHLATVEFLYTIRPPHATKTSDIETHDKNQIRTRSEAATASIRRLRGTQGQHRSERRVGPDTR
jgi:hypothetical protein